MKKNFPADLFDASASMCMLRFISHETDYEVLAVQIVEKYRDDITDIAAAADIQGAADKAFDWLDEQECDFDLLLFLKAFHRHCIDTRPDGKPARKWLNGLWFSRDLPDPGRQLRFLQRLQGFYIAHELQNKTRYVLKGPRLDLTKG
ncbi:hypothetical protein ACYCFK_17735 [Stutzerimonas stutzeri]